MTSPRERRRHRARHESTLYLNVLNVLRYARLRGLTIFRRPCLTGPERAVRHLADTNTSPLKHLFKGFQPPEQALRCGRQSIRNSPFWPDLIPPGRKAKTAPGTPNEFPAWNVTPQYVFNSAVIPRAGLRG
jgi:hypothetical protein